MTTAVNLAGAGTISPASGWYDDGAGVSVSAMASAGRQFIGFSGALSGTTNPQNVTMNGPKSVTANFTTGADLTITLTDSGDFTQGVAGSWYTITVSNVGTGPTAGTVTVTDTLPTGVTATLIKAQGWTCTQPSSHIDTYSASEACTANSMTPLPNNYAVRLR